jgi:hypothetical protein
MEVRKLMKDGQVLTTEDGQELTENRFEVGDTFIPLFNSVLENTKEVEVKNQKTGEMEKKNITNYSLKCVVRDVNGEEVTQTRMVDEKEVTEKEIFIGLTPAQAKSLKKKVEEGVELNQNLFVAYNYHSKDYGKQIGIGIKKANKPAKSFEDFDNKTEEIKTTETETKEEETE